LADVTNNSLKQRNNGVKKKWSEGNEEESKEKRRIKYRNI
jgi:hypothetical protein